MQRAPDLPDVPTPAEAGLKNAESLIWFGVFLPLLIWCKDVDARA